MHPVWIGRAARAVPKYISLAREREPALAIMRLIQCAHGHFSKFTFFISAMKRGSERSGSKILSILSQPIHSEWAA